MKTFKKIIITILCVILATALVWGILFLTVPNVKDKTYELFNIQDKVEKYVLTIEFYDDNGFFGDSVVECKVKLLVDDKEVQSGDKVASGKIIKGYITLMPTEKQETRNFLVLAGDKEVDFSQYYEITKLDNLNYTFESEMPSKDLVIAVISLSASTATT